MKQPGPSLLLGWPSAKIVGHLHGVYTEREALCVASGHELPTRSPHSPEGGCAEGAHARTAGELQRPHTAAPEVRRRQL